MRKAIHLTMTGGKSPRQHMWEAIRSLSRDPKGLTTYNVSRLSGQEDQAVSSYPSPSTRAVERRVVAALGALDCPAQGEPISLIECQSYREKKAPTHNPQAMQQWKACQHCTHNPNCANALEASHASQH